ncbi:DUF2125 domain-containing protein [Azospirillum sp.]|uniref:DUF2125 domain-containing protein n=1 Tax=Azospirillum sp. TaxID=34012 RepID=UPI002D27567F|nr:DUF2125 domain-containing protein [Azospirillum sp.]HYD68456.1 DUF2125 domain-containing protein [Azospirillum sp.]
MTLRKRLALAAAVLFVALLAAWGVAWWMVAKAVENGIVAWAEAQRARGVDVRYADLRMGGFPLAVRATATEPRIAARGADWRGAELVGEAPLWDPTRIALTLPGPQRLRLSDPASPPGELVAPQGGTGHVTLGPAGVPVEARLSFADLTFAPAALPDAPAAVSALDLTLRQPPAPPASHEETGLAVEVDARGVRLPSAVQSPLGPIVSRATATVRVQGRPPELHPESLAAWSRDGGTVQMDALGLDWGPLKATVNGTLALDRDLQPQAAMTAEVRGADKVLAAFQGQLKPNEVNMARSVIGMLARPSQDGEPVIMAPLTIQYRALFVGPLKVAAIPAIVW